MKKLLLLLTTALILIPSLAFAVTSVPWSITNTSDTFIFPNLINGVKKGVLISASSTINSTLTVSSLTSGNCVQAGTGGLLTTVAAPCGTGSSASSTLLGDSNTFSGFNKFTFQTVFGGLFATNASSTNGTTTTFAITGAGATNCNGTSALTTNSTGVVGCTAQPQGTVTSVSGTANQIDSTGGATPVLSLSSHVIFPSGGYEAAIGSTTSATSTNFYNIGSSTIAGAFNSTLSNFLGSSTLLGSTLFANATGTNLAITGSSTVVGGQCSRK